MSPILRILIGGACTVLIIAGLKAASDIVGFVLIAALLAISITPVVLHYFQNWEIPLVAAYSL